MTAIRLKYLHEKAQQALGESAPSYISIKRLSAKGAFEFLDEPQILDLLRSRFGNRSKPDKPNGSVSHGPSTPPTLAATDSPGIDAATILMQVLSKLNALDARLERYEKQVDSLQAAASQLGAVRNTLMAKYDAVSSNQIQAIEALRAHKKDLDRVEGLNMEITRLRGQIQRLVDARN